MTEQPEQSTPQISALPVLIVGGFIVIFGVIFIIEFAGLSGTGGEGLADEDVTAASYMDIVEPLLVDADPAQAPEIMARSELICMSCHMDGSNVAPMFSNVADVAGERRAPMQPAAYIYESIVHPGAYVAEGSWGDSNNMPRYYRERLTDEELGSLIAWLLLTPAERGALDAPATVTSDAAPVDDMPIEDTLELTADTYMDVVAPLLVETDPARGPDLLQEYACSACHEPPNAGVIGPGHDDLAQLAAQRRAPLTAPAYVYESIIYPDRHLVDGYQDAMPKDYGERMSNADLGDLIAYLLLSTDEKSALE